MPARSDRGAGEARYDDCRRRSTPLARSLAEDIRRGGPIPVRDFVTRCLHDPDHGYYRARAAIGRSGDFITAPEISQIFGELIGLWAASVWLAQGAPSGLDLVELGPGRGTMMADMLRAMRVVPGLGTAARIHLIEPSPHLTGLQRKTLAAADAHITWHPSLDALLAAEPSAGRGLRPMIVIANEVLDTMCPEQLVRTPDGWAMRGVGLDTTGSLAFTTSPLDPAGRAIDASELDQTHPDAVPGDIVERARLDLDALLALESATHLLIDYGHTAPAVGDTLQAVREHGFEHPLTSPGEADLSTSVDFSALVRRVAREPRLMLHGPITQAELLGRLGIVERASRLMAANPAEAAGLEAGVARLLAPLGMGGRFHAVAITLRGAPTPPAFNGA